MKLIRIPQPGNSWNPMKSHPRNALCFCGSDKKFKKCCLPTLGPTVPTDKVQMLKNYLKLREKGLHG